MDHTISLFFRSIFVDNMIFAFFLGMCSFLAVSKNVKTSLGLGLAVTFVLVVTVPVDYLLQTKILGPDCLVEGVDLSYLSFILFIAVIAGMVQLVEMVIRKFSPSLYKALGIYLPLITTNCAVLGIAIINIDSGYNLLESFFAGAAAGLGFTMAIILMSNIREKLELTPVRKSFKGVPITFISAGIMALAFMAFDSSLLTNLGLV